MPRPTVCNGRSRRLAPVPGVGLEPAAGQMVRTAGALRPKAGRRTETRSSPSMQAPRSPAPRVGIKRRLLEKRSRARRQSRTGHGRTRREGGPPSPPAHPPLHPSLLPKEAAPKRSGSQKCHKGSHRAADPGALFSRIGRSSARALSRNLCAAEGATPGRSATRSASLGRRRLGARASRQEVGGRRAQDVWRRAMGVDHRFQSFQFTMLRWALAPRLPGAAPARL
jgi:hypothetical protein